MDRLPLFFLILCLPTLNALDASLQIRDDVPAEGYYNPRSTGGSMLTQVVGTFPEGQGEPVNAIISANSDPDVLVDQELDGGLLNYFLSLQFSTECLGQHQGNSQKVNLGDGNGYLNETAVMRYNYGDAALGACTETIKGGNHFRYWVQNGDNANSGAVFMAFSYEMSISLGHDIVLNGYNLARDYMVGNITRSTIPTLNLTNTTTFSGTTMWNDYTYHTDVKYVSGLLDNTSIGINHNWSVYIDGVTNAVDGLVAVLDVTITGRPEGDGNNAWSTTPATWCLLLALLASLISI